ncbi:helix-turn-helix transcriptional regulator [Cellulosimicrobium cellulans]|nr:helix-turn-helix transcriptional regulator [Cellulosimicrobium cellulans]
MDRDFAEPLRLADVAADAGYSPYHFARAFTRAFGTSPVAYLATRRVERAKDLLRSANLTVTEVCHAVGYTSLGSFSARFREIVGVSPRAYRDAHARSGPPPVPGCFALAWGQPRPGGTARSEKPPTVVEP